jgi:hypothetical protein
VEINRIFYNFLKVLKRLVLVSEFAFDGTIVPVATIIFGYVCVAIIWYALIQKNENMGPNLDTDKLSPSVS